MLSSHSWLVTFELRKSLDGIKYVIQIEYDEIINVLFAFQRVVDSYYTFLNGDRCACGKAHRYLR